MTQDILKLHFFLGFLYEVMQGFYHQHAQRLQCSSFLVLTYFLLRDYNILPKKELLASLWAMTWKPQNQRATMTEAEAVASATAKMRRQATVEVPALLLGASRITFLLHIYMDLHEKTNTQIHVYIYIYMYLYIHSCSNRYPKSTSK